MSKKRGSGRRPAGRRRGLLGLTVVLLACAAAVAGYVVTRGWPQSSEATAAGTSAPAGGDEAGGDNAAGTSAPATPTEDTTGGEAANPSSGQTVATDEPAAPTRGGTSTVPVVVTYYGWNPDTAQVLVGGYASGIVEDGGTCTLTLTQGGATVTAKSAANPDAVTTACGQLVVPRAQLAKGTWQAVLRYRSASSAGEAAAVPIEVTR
jgi:hypothetical protein